MRKFKTTVVNTWGDQGRDWLARLPEIIAQLSAYWELSDITPVTNMSYNYIVKAKQKNNTPVILKISCDKQLIDDEYKALRYFNGQGSIRVLDVHPDLNALLLEQAIPGNLLKAKPSAEIETTISIYAEVVKALASTSNVPDDVPHIEKWCEAIDRISDERIEERHLSKAKELREFLLTSIEKEYVCHGDLHLENIIQQGRQWLSIDPKGIIGEIAFEAAAFDLIHQSEWGEFETIQNKLFTRIDLLAASLEIDKNRLLAWIFLRVIISAQWFIEDHGNPAEMLRLADHLYPLLTKQYNKTNACLTYEKISDWYYEHRCNDLFEKEYLDKIISHIPARGSILDLGCGTGQPMAEYFIDKGFVVTGVDGSQAQIEKGKKLVPKMTFICKDMRDVHLGRQFNCIIAWHSFFHLTKADQREMFKIFEEHIAPHGLLVFTSGPNEGEVWSENGGEMLYHASLGENEYRTLLNRHHFDVLTYKAQDPACGDATVWVAKRREYYEHFRN